MLGKLIRSLTRLIETAIRLPRIERDPTERDLHDIEMPDAPEDTVNALIDEHLSFGFYWSAAPDPSEDVSHWTNDIFEDLCDTWVDLHWGLELLDVRAETSEAYASELWRQTFRSHWGRHATEALRALLYLEGEHFD
jgi:hypothetical protein